MGVQRARKTFDAAKKTLRAKRVKYAMRFPAKLKILAGDKPMFFTDPEQAADYADKLPKANDN